MHLLLCLCVNLFPCIFEKDRVKNGFVFLLRLKTIKYADLPKERGKQFTSVLPAMTMCLTACSCCWEFQGLTNALRPLRAAHFLPRLVRSSAYGGHSDALLTSVTQRYRQRESDPQHSYCAPIPLRWGT